jgi:hypothetical protein
LFLALGIKLHQHYWLTLWLTGIRETVSLHQSCSTWALQAAPSVIQRSIKSVYPLVNGPACEIGKLLNAIFLPLRRRDEIHNAVSIMWTSCRSPASSRTWTPNHFVPLIPFDDVSNPSAAQLSPPPDPVAPSDDQLSPPHASTPSHPSTDTVGYRVVAAGTKRDKALLVDPQNFKYQVDKRRGDRIYWRCCSRSKTGCGVTVIQVGDIYMPGRHQHVDTSIPGSYEAATVRANVISNCLKDIFRSANDVVDDALHDVLDKQYNGPCASFANPSN